MLRRSDEADRSAVIREMERRLKQRLRSIGNHRKYFQDESGNRVCIFVGRGQLHGLPCSVVEDGHSSSFNGTIVVAMRHSDRLSLYSGPLKSLVDNLAELSHSKNQYIFEVSLRGSDLTIDQIPSMRLSHMCDIPHGDLEHLRMKQHRAAKKAFDTLSVNERKQLIERLKKEI